MNKWPDKIKKFFRLAILKPKELLNIFKRNIWSNIFPPKSGEISLNGIHYYIDLDIDPQSKNMYYSLYQSEVILALKKYLRKGDIFIDIGANLGYISAYALSLVGKEGEVHSFEPVPRCIKYLKYVKDKNPEYRFYINNIALGDKEEVKAIDITNLPNIGWNTMVPGFMENAAIGESKEVQVSKLDNYLYSEKINLVSLIKIDTEGYEFPIMEGMQSYLSSTSKLPIFIIEIAPKAYPRLGLSLTDFEKFMLRFGYRAYALNSRYRLDIKLLENTTDVIFLPVFCGGED